VDVQMITGINGFTQDGSKRSSAVKSNKYESKFSAVLAGTEIKFSNHAMNRLSQRGITLSNQEIDKLNDAINHAVDKGSRDSLVLLNDLAFIVSVRSRTVVTAIQTGRMKESIFTNIDSTVIA